MTAIDEPVWPFTTKNLTQKNVYKLQNELPKALVKKSVQDEAAMQAVEGYEFMVHVPESAPDYDSIRNSDFEPLASATRDEQQDHQEEPKVLIYMLNIY